MAVAQSQLKQVLIYLIKHVIYIIFLLFEVLEKFKVVIYHFWRIFRFFILFISLATSTLLLSAGAQRDFLRAISLKSLFSWENWLKSL